MIKKVLEAEDSKPSLAAAELGRPPMNQDVARNLRGQGMGHWTTESFPKKKGSSVEEAQWTACPPSSGRVLKEAPVTGIVSAGLCVAGDETGRGNAVPATAQGSLEDEVFPGDVDWKDGRSPVGGMPTEPRKLVEEAGGLRLGAADEDNGKFTVESRPGHDQAVGEGM